MKSDGMADIPQSGIPAFTSWIAEISDAFSNGFRRLSLNRVVDSGVSVKDESSEVEQNLMDVHGSGVDPQEKLALRDQGSRFEYALSVERLTPIREETDELESRRSLLASRCSDAGKMWVSSCSNELVHLLGPFWLRLLSVHLV